ncbi:PfkB family carbohydrate kinase [Mesobacillus maritimus]|uniref:Fructoselysine 6-kinase n=1 Tax=Mesobacillus maritimus TaxID=1643336 RepID=A0ABS7KAT4_9BACI|nr:PfkB family carbohydrate kinase [Mesobacillus maritimus]MBY0099225.1 fructoselysine 6-kinase [Mesobacillus maritimus]
MLKVLGLGDNVVDKYEHIHTMYPGGNALNFAVFAKKFGADAAFLGAFGTDQEAEHVQESVRTIGLDTTHCKQYEGENGCARVTLREGDRVFLGSNRCGVLSQYGLNLTPDDFDYIKHFDLVHSGLYGFAEAELPKLKELGVSIGFDFSSDFTEEKVNQIAPFVDFAYFSSSHLPLDEMLNLMVKVTGLGCQLVLCTMGEKGALLFDGETFYMQEPDYVKPTDTMGAGDSFITCFIVQYLSKTKHGNTNRAEIIKDSLKEAARFSAEQCLVDGSFGFGKVY